MPDRPVGTCPPAAPARPGRLRGRRGIALLLTLLVLTILLILVTQLRITTRLHVLQARNLTGDLQNAQGAFSALAFARLYIQTDTEVAPAIDTLQEPWARPIQIPGLEEATVQLTIEDEERRFNLGRLVLPDGKPNPLGRAQFRRLVALLGIPDPKLADRIADYIDPDQEGEFEAGAKNRPLVIPEEFAMIPGVYPEFLYGGINPETRQAFKGLLEYISLWPVPQLGTVTPDGAAGGGAAPPPADGTPPEGTPAPPKTPPNLRVAPNQARLGVNANTVLPEVLASLSEEVPPEMAQAIVAYRMGTDEQGKPTVFTNVPDLYRVPGMTERAVNALKGELVFKSMVFSARAVCRSRNVTRRVRFVLERSAPMPLLLTWWEEGGAFGVPQPENAGGALAPF
jgi:type II secretory pathway component PulK